MKRLMWMWMWMVVLSDDYCIDEKGRRVPCIGQSRPVDHEKPRNMGKFHVVFENESTERVQLYWDGGAPSRQILMGELDPQSDQIVETSEGHSFYFADDHGNRLFSIKASPLEERHVWRGRRNEKKEL